MSKTQAHLLAGRVAETALLLLDQAVEEDWTRDPIEDPRPGDVIHLAFGGGQTRCGAPMPAWIEGNPDLVNCIRCRDLA
jgi:hypothetical protein